MVDYFERADVPGKVFFQCDRMRAKLSTTSCASMWRKADEISDGSHSACKLCPIGAVHAGEVAASMSPLKGSLTCARCHRTAMRLIGKMLCVSCQNRQYEAIKGRNSKGKAPVKLGPLNRRSIRYMHGDEPRTLAMAQTVDIDELIIAALRDSKKAVVFAFNSAPPAAIKQARLW